jgi:hypothetical protein
MHPPRPRTFCSCLELLLALAGLTTPLPAADPSPEGAEFFEKKIRPILVENCFKCHGGGKKKGSLALDSRAGLLRGGDNGPAVVPGKPEESRLLEAVSYKNVELQMPPKGRLPENAVRDLTTWIQMGAPWPVQRDATATAAKGGLDIEQRKRAHWAWRPVRPSPPPAVRNAAWPLGAVDRFILARLEEKGLAPAADADRRTWLRRVSFDLIGLPPAPEDINAFLKDPSQEAYARVVERLLASPHFGEHWARPWLDLVRYAESRGHEFDYSLPSAWQYRDYVIRAFNADVPYGQLVVEHLAGDLLEKPRLHPREGFNESVLGTAFWFLGEEVHSPVDVALDEADRFDNRIDVMTKTFLGLTVACARCHDHKFDAISTRDYYSLYGFLQSSSYRLVRFDTCGQEKQTAAALAGLRARGRVTVGRALAGAARLVAGRLADYLMAAAEIAFTRSPRPEELARERHLDAALLKGWVEELLRASKDADHPLHPFARAGRTQARSASEGKSHPSLALRASISARPGVVSDASVVVDYGHLRPQSWITDGGAFGTGPVLPGQLLLSGTPEHPQVRIVTRAAAQVDRAWPALRAAAGSENDAGALGSLMRAGRTLCTPSFIVGPGKVFYLVRGAGQAYASVHSHVLIAGPLHGNVVQGIQTTGWQWIGHDLTRYQGCRAHVEFTPRDGADFAVALVIQADRAPPLLEPTDPALLDLVASHGGSIADLAAGYQRLIEQAVGQLADDRVDPGSARLASWLVQRPELFGAAGALAQAAGGVVADQARLLSGLRTESRLCPAMLDGTGMDGRVFIRGSAKAPGEVVPRRFLEALAGPDRLAVARGSGRLELARQMTDPRRNPFLARVLVNRIWHHLFGRGIVASVDNFGVLGEPPTHPELLDYLAAQFVEQGWSIKALIRTLVLSHTYRMSCSSVAQSAALDPQNLLVHRMRLRRLGGEAIRDALLSVSDRLDGRMYGPPVPVHLNEFQTGRGQPASGPLDGAGRRSVYLSVRRNFLSSLFLAFDTPIPFSTVGRRSVSNVPAQALILMNDPFFHQQAEVWARRTLAVAGTPYDRLHWMYLRAFGREPTDEECRSCLDFLRRQAAAPDALAAWVELAHALINTKEFFFLP